MLISAVYQPLAPKSTMILAGSWENPSGLKVVTRKRRTLARPAAVVYTAATALHADGDADALQRARHEVFPSRIDRATEGLHPIGQRLCLKLDLEIFIDESN